MEFLRLLGCKTAPKQRLKERAEALSKNPNGRSNILCIRIRITGMDLDSKKRLFSSACNDNVIDPKLKVQSLFMKVKRLKITQFMKAQNLNLKDNLNPLIRFLTSSLGRCGGFTVVPSAVFISGWPGKP